MGTRYNTRSSTRFGVPGLPSGFGSKSTSSLTIPAVGLEDAERGLFNLFESEIPFTITDDRGARRVPVIFAVGEKWAVLKNGRALRDRNNTLILPLITITRANVQQLAADDIAGRGINQQTGEIVIKRKLDKTDRSYQNLVNKYLLVNQANVAAPASLAAPGQLATQNSVGELSNDPTFLDGGVLASNRLNNVYETIVVPSPQFYTGFYDVIFWTQYTQHMNQLLEQLVSSFLPQGNAWRVDTSLGYWFVAAVENNTYNPENNFDDMSQSEKFIKYKFSIRLPGYILATAVPGAPVPVKRYVSVPSISFDVGSDESEQAGVDDPFLGSDDPTLPTSDVPTSRPDQRQTNSTRLFPSRGAEADAANPDDPALGQLPRGRVPAKFKKITGIDKSGNTVTKYVRVASTNSFTGETSFVPDSTLGGLTIVVSED